MEPSANNQLHEMNISSKIELPTPIDVSLKNILEKENIIEPKIDWRCLTFDGSSYLCTLYEIDVSGRTTDEEKEINLFIKHKADGTAIKVLSVSVFFLNELFAYKELFKIFTEFQEAENIPLEERFKTIKVYEESNEEIIILENITKKGYAGNHKINMVSLNFFEMSIKELAKFHALSFVLKERRPKFFDENIKHLKHPYIFGEDWEQLVEGLRGEGIKNVDEEFKDKMNRVYDDLAHKYSEYCEDPTIKVCLCHGDSKYNNLLSTKNENENQKVMLIDFQTIYYGSPVLDFLFLIFTGTDKEFRRANLLNLKELYYGTLSDFLGCFHLDVNTVYPRKDFEKVYKEKLDFGLMSAILCLPFMMASGDKVPDVSHSEWNFKHSKGIKALYHGVIEEFIEWGYL